MCLTPLPYGSKTIENYRIVQITTMGWVGAYLSCVLGVYV